MRGPVIITNLVRNALFPSAGFEFEKSRNWMVLLLLKENVSSELVYDKNVCTPNLLVHVHNLDISY